MLHSNDPGGKLPHHRLATILVGRTPEGSMSILSWIAVGAAAGALFGLVESRRGIPENVIVGVVGAIVGGWLFAVLGGAETWELGLPGVVAALAGSLLFIALARGVSRGRTAI